MTENRQLQQARRWCDLMTLAHFSIALNATQKAVILNADGSKFANVPAKYQAAVWQLLTTGVTFAAAPIQPRQPARSYRAESSRQPTERKKIMRQSAGLIHARPAHASAY